MASIIEDPMTSLTGYGQPCTDLSNCIQRSEVMRCAREVSGDVTKRCLCTDDSYRTGSTCKRSKAWVYDLSVRAVLKIMNLSV